MIRERRKFPRFSTVMPATLELPDGQRMVVNTEDLSREGAKIQLSERLPAGVHVMVEITAPDPDKGRKTLQLWGNTLHSRSLDDDNFSLGIHFDKPSSDYKGLIMALSPSIH